jgi:hypothetical protein
MIAGGGCLALVLVSVTLTPNLVLLPDGAAPRWSEAFHRGRSEFVWLLRALVAALIGSGVTLVVQHFT